MTNATCDAPISRRAGRTPTEWSVRFVRQVGAALARRRAEKVRRKRIAAMQRLMAGLPLATQRDVGWPKRYFDLHPDDAE